jgi:hypothetical protein
VFVYFLTDLEREFGEKGGGGLWVGKRHDLGLLESLGVRFALDIAHVIKGMFVNTENL